MSSVDQPATKPRNSNVRFVILFLLLLGVLALVVKFWSGQRSVSERRRDTTAIFRLEHKANQARMGGDFDTAIDFQKQALDQARVVFVGPDAEQLPRVVETYGTFLMQAGRHDEAVPILDEAVTLYTRTFGAEKPATKAARSKLDRAREAAK